MAMRGFTARQQAALDELDRARCVAQERFEADIASLTGYSSRVEHAQNVIHHFITENAQELLDMLIKHFEPSPVYDAEPSTDKLGSNTPGFVPGVPYTRVQP